MVRAFIHFIRCLKTSYSTLDSSVVFMVVELLVNRLSINALHVIFALLYGLIYLTFALILWKMTGRQLDFSLFYLRLA